MSDLTINELTELEEWESVVEFGVEMWLAAGSALKTIRDKRLYRETDKTWEGYLTRRWSHLFSDDSTANRWIAAAEIQAELTPIGVSVEHEYHARELAKFAPTLRQTVALVAKAAADIEGRDVTGSIIKHSGRQVVQALESLTSADPEQQTAFINSIALNVVAERMESIRQKIAQKTGQGGNTTTGTTPETVTPSSTEPALTNTENLVAPASPQLALSTITDEYGDPDPVAPTVITEVKTLDSTGNLSFYLGSEHRHRRVKVTITFLDE